jgi:hypothetical protein
MKKKKYFIVYLIAWSILIQNSVSFCSQLKNCSHQCKNSTRDCLIKAQVYNQPFTSSSSSSSNTTTTSTSSSPSTNSELEPNDTFFSSAHSLSTNDNAIASDSKNSYLKNASMASNSDIDIFRVSIANSSFTITQKSGIGSVTCNLYYQSSNTIYTQSTSVPDSTFTSLGTLNTPYSFNYKGSTDGFFYIICTGTSGTSYSIQTDPIQSSSSSSNSLLSTTNIINFSSLQSCAGTHSACMNKCSK